MISKNENVGLFEIYVNGEFSERIFNRVMDVVIQSQLDILKGIGANLDIKYLALGTDNTPITDTDTQLGNEIFRTAYVERTEPGTAQLQHRFIALTSDAVAQIEEIGIFGGATATSTANTGILISRILWSRNKTNSEEITFIRTDKVVRG